LIAGFAAGAILGGPWTLIAPIAGFGFGLTGDLTLIRYGLHSIHKNAEQWVRIKQSEPNHKEPTEI